MKYKSFQNGSLVRRPDVDGFTWVLRYYKDGVKKALSIGTNRDLPTEAAARRKAADMVPVINDSKVLYTFAQLVERYKLEELPERPHVAASYKSVLKHLTAKWGEYDLPTLMSDLMAIQTWVSNIQTLPTKTKPARPASKKTKQNAKAIMHRLINCAMKWGYLPVTANPIGLVEVKVSGVQPKKRLKKPVTSAQLMSLIRDPEMPEHVRVMTKLAVGLGLRISEVLGFKWEDIDLELGVIRVMRSSVGKYIGDTKSAESGAEDGEGEMPLHPYLVHTLKKWQEFTPSVGGWVFGNVTTGRPFHRDSLQVDHLAPAGRRAGIPSLGWHTFRHTQSKSLRENKVPLEVQQMMMRHATVDQTNEYGKDDGSLELKREAHNLVIESLFGEEIVKDGIEQHVSQFHRSKSS